MRRSGASASASAASSRARTTRSPTSPASASGTRRSSTATAPLVVGRGPVRTGVTIVDAARGRRLGRARVRRLPPAQRQRRAHRASSGSARPGLLGGPVAITNTHSVGVVRDALVAPRHRASPRRAAGCGRCRSSARRGTGCSTTSTASTSGPSTSMRRSARRTTAPVAQGNVGGGTGMVCHEFKGGIGTASRVVAAEAGGWTVGVLVQANYGEREQLRSTASRSARRSRSPRCRRRTTRRRSPTRRTRRRTLAAPGHAPSPERARSS